MVAMAGDWKALYAAACAGDLGEVAYALAQGVDPNHQHPEFGTTPLIGATENGQLEAVRLLLEGGADPQVRSEWDGVSAVDVARSRGFSAIQAILEAGRERADDVRRR